MVYFTGIFYQYNSKEPSEKRKTKLETAGKKNNDTLFSASHNTLTVRVLRNNEIS